MSIQPGSTPIRSAFCDDPEMLELVQMFVSDMPERVAEMQRLWGEARLSELARLAHQLKGASGGYGFEPLGDAAARLESSLKSDEKNLQALHEQLQELVDLCSRAAA